MNIYPFKKKYELEKVNKFFRAFQYKSRIKETVRPGSFVKLGFMICGGGAESMWVIVDRIDGGRYSGRLDNHPVFVNLNLGDVINFTIDNIKEVEGLELI